mgnify:CR=1 FL=1
MENGSIADAVIANRGLNFATPYGGGYGGGGGYGREFANDGSNAVRINAAERASNASHDSLSQQISDNADRNRDIQQLQVSDNHFNGVLDKISDQSRFFTSEINLITREQAANAREAAKCCCEAKVLAVQNQAKTDMGMATIIANQACDVRVSDAVANTAQNAKLDALLAERGHGHGRG